MSKTAGVRSEGVDKIVGVWVCRTAGVKSEGVWVSGTAGVRSEGVWVSVTTGEKRSAEESVSVLKPEEVVCPSL